MLKQAGILFALTLMTSMAGFGGMIGTEHAVAPTKAGAVFFLCLFFVALHRVLADAAPARSADREPRALDEPREIATRGQRAEGAPRRRSLES